MKNQEQAIRTRCIFRVVGVEETEYEVLESVEEGDPRFAAMPEPEGWFDNRGEKPVKRKLRRTGKCKQYVRLMASAIPPATDDATDDASCFAAKYPSGDLKIYVDNPDVIGTFKPGQNYFVDLIPCKPE